MELDPQLMGQYADFLEDFSGQIQQLCRGMEELTGSASQCMDQLSGQQAARALLDNMERILANIPTADEACKKLILVMKRIADAQNTFGHGR